MAELTGPDLGRDGAHLHLHGDERNTNSISGEDKSWFVALQSLTPIIISISIHPHPGMRIRMSTRLFGTYPTPWPDRTVFVYGRAFKRKRVLY